MWVQKLRQLQMAQIQMHAAYMATETSRKDNERKITDQHFVKFTPKKNNRFSSAGGLK
jgi:P-type conjugative transfer protein TrbJ